MRASRRRTEHPVALVVHGGSAIGGAVADRLAADGARVRTADDRGCLEEDAIRACVDQLGGLDVAAIVLANSPTRAFPRSSSDDDRARIVPELRSTFFVVQAAVRAMRGGGRICIAAAPRPVNAAANLPAPATLVEGGLIAMVRLLAVELAPDIAVNAVCPVASSVDPAAVASALAFLASRDASYMTGSFVPVLR